MIDTQAIRGIAGAQAIDRPVSYIPRDVPDRPPRQGIALCLSGGGYRAMLFHLGALWRLNELGLLVKLDRVSSVSGGSITAGKLAQEWSHLRFDASGVSATFVDRVVAPIRRLAGTTIDVWAVLSGWLGCRINNQLARHLFGPATLQELPDRPFFVFNASNVQSGALLRFTKPYLWDWKVGRVDRPRTPLAVAVAASAAFPPVLSPVVLRFSDRDFVPGSGGGLESPEFRRRVVLTDGGVYDNLGLETAWKHYATVLVSNGSRGLEPEPKPAWDWLRHTNRVVNLICNQVGSLRVRQLIASYESSDPVTRRAGAYWGIGGDIRRYKAPGSLPCPVEATLDLADTATRLKRMDDRRQERLINWGYAICDAAIRSHFDQALPAPLGFPYPVSGV